MVESAAPNERRCSQCRFDLPLSAFRPKSGGVGWIAHCRDCEAVNAAWKREARRAPRAELGEAIRRMVWVGRLGENGKEER